MTERRFAAFDIDGTIFRWQLYHELFDAFVEEGIVSESDAATVFAVREQWRSRQLDYHTYEMTLVKVMGASIIGIDATEFGRIADRILDAKGHHTYRYTLDLLRRLKSEGYVIIAISGSYQQLVDRFAALHDIDIAVGREHTIVDGRLTAESKDIFGHKDQVLKDLVRQHGLTFDESYAVGDSGGDIEMLEVVERPIAFNPDETLKSHAMTNGWPIVIERKSISYKLERGDDGTYVLA
jgi:HAD superfamily hydrolase (TIGR01490 family)